MAELMTISELAKLTGESRANVHLLSWQEGDFPPVAKRAGRVRLYEKTAFLKWYRRYSKRVASWHAARKRKG